MFFFHKNIGKRGINFHGNRLLTVEAPEPSEIIWENINKSRTKKIMLRLASLFSLSVILLLISAIVFYLLTYQKDEFQEYLNHLNFKIIVNQKSSFLMNLSWKALENRFYSLSISIIIVIINSFILEEIVIWISK